MEQGSNTAFTKAYKQLNAAQKKAVDTIDGPLLVIAGPGTGKTQLLSARVANILAKTDTLPQNILCLTFTESGALNMRERLSRFIGQSAYDVTISTYHALGSDILRRYPQYFTEYRLESAIDDLGKHQIVSSIVEGMSYSNPLKQTRHHLGDLLATISEIKRGLLNSDDLRVIARENASFITIINQQALEIFKDFTRMPGTYAKAVEPFSQLHQACQLQASQAAVIPRFGSLASAAADSLGVALEIATETNSSKPLTAWKNIWLVKDENNHLVFDGELENARIEALAGVLEAYQAALTARGQYDFDDMITRAIGALKEHDDLRFTLQEQYLYILLDEFQDTNAAQLQLVTLLTDNPINEGRPNVMAVGDDDQAIYAFQGAEYSNMLDFYQMYKGVDVISLKENYRSVSEILQTASSIANQIGARLQDNFEGVTKELIASNNSLAKSHIRRQDFLSPLAQYDWIATEINNLIDKGTAPKEIAVLAPRHKHLEPLTAHLNARGIPVRYEKRENILEAPVVSQLLTMSQLVIALSQKNDGAANSLWPEVLSFDFWQLPTSSIWNISWLTGNKERHISWSQALLEDGETFRRVALLFLTLAHKTKTTSLETMLDYLIGNELADTNEADTPQVGSPLKDFYLSAANQTKHPELFYETLSHITVLRAKLRAYQDTSEHVLKLGDFVSFVNEYEAAETPILNSSPYNQDANAVQLMTVFKAKGLEFEHVFLPSLQDDVWGSSNRGSSNKLTLPANLVPIRYAGTTEDERLRLLFVALTRARVGLHLTSYRSDYAGKLTKRLKYLDEQEIEADRFKALKLPEAFQDIFLDESVPPHVDTLRLDWRTRHLDGLAETSLKSLLEERLENYQLSPTHLNSFTNLEYAGPERFFFSTILRFPEAPGIDGQFGNAIHETLESLQYAVTETGKQPDLSKTLTTFKENLETKHLLPADFKLQYERGVTALTAFLKSYTSYKSTDKAEVNFRNENVFIGDAHLAGKIDRLEIDAENKTIIVVDYKTGRSYDRWENIPKLYRYRQQLYAYKLLLEHSRTFANYKVVGAKLAFVETDQRGRINILDIKFSDDEMHRVEGLLQALWRHVKALDFPDTSAYPATMTGIKRFEDDLLAGTL